MSYKETENNYISHPVQLAEKIHSLACAVEEDTFSVTTAEVAYALHEASECIKDLVASVDLLESKYSVVVVVNDTEIRIDDSVINQLFNTVVRDWVLNAIASYAVDTQMHPDD